MRTRTMALLCHCHGYNLLNVAGVPVPLRGRANLEKARLALLNFLAESLDPDAVPADGCGVRRP